MNVISKANPAWSEYPYPSEGGSLIYKSGQPPKYEDHDNDDSFNVPLNRSEKSFNNGGADTSNIYSEVKVSEMGKVKTRTTSPTHTKAYKTGTFEVTTGSGSSDATSHNENAQQVKTKHSKKQMLDASDSITPSLSSGIPSFTEADVPPQQKAKRPKKHKKKDRSGGEEDFEVTDEPLPGGKYRSDGSDSTDAHKPVAKPRRSAGSPSFA